MKKLLLGLCFLTIFNSCSIYYYLNDLKSSKDTYGSKANAPGTFYYKYASGKQFESASKLKEKHGAETDRLINQSVICYSFAYSSTGDKDAQPVKIYEQKYQNVVALENNVEHYKYETYNDQIEFLGFEVRYTTTSPTYYKPTYSISNINEDYIFFSDAKVASFKMAMPALGTEVSIRSKKKYNDAKYLTTLYFPEQYATTEKIVSFQLPSWLKVEILEYNLEGYELTKSTSRPKDIDNKFEYFEDTKKIKDNFTYVTYKLNNLKAPKSEGLAPGPSYNKPHLIIMIKEIDLDKAKRLFPKDKSTNKKDAKNDITNRKTSKHNDITASKNVTLIKNLDDLYTWYHSIANLTENDTAKIGKVARGIVSDIPVSNRLERMEKIFYWVQDNIKYIAYEDGIAAFKPEECQDVYNNKFGDCKGMANLLKNMLLTLGFDARLTWIGTNYIYHDYRTPVASVDNHMICTVILDNKKYFLDGTENYIGVNDYAHRIQGRPMLIEDGNKYLIDTVPNLSYSRNRHYKKAKLAFASDELTGTVKEVITGENKTRFLNNYHMASENDKPEVLKNQVYHKFGELLSSNITTSDLSNRTIPVEINYSLVVKKNSFSEGNTIFIQPDLSMELQNHQVNEDRTSDLAYAFKLNYEHDYTIEIPKGYKLNWKPEDIFIDNPEFIIEVKYAIVGQSIQYNKRLILKSGFITKKNFSEWNKAITKLNKNYKSYLQFKKA